ncbi:MAG: hypothetical protein ABJN98_14175 [Roseibium sp.]
MYSPSFNEQYNLQAGFDYPYLVQSAAIDIQCFLLTFAFTNPITLSKTDNTVKTANSPTKRLRSVSNVLRARAESCVIALPETLTIGKRQVRIFGWYDNEWGFSARMIDMARLMVGRG